MSTGAVSGVIETATLLVALPLAALTVTEKRSVLTPALGATKLGRAVLAASRLTDGPSV